MEQLLGTVLLSLPGRGPTALLIDIENVKKRCEKASLSQRERKILKRTLSKSFEKSPEKEELWCALLTLYQRGTSLRSLFGISVDGYSFSWTEDPIRFQHVAGLADAISLSMTNLGVSVALVSQETVKAKSVDGGRKAYSGLVRFKNGNINEPYRLFYRYTTRNRRLALIRHLLPQIPLNSGEKYLVRRIKDSLVDCFCLQTDQERPNCEIRPLDLFPEEMQKRLDRLFSKNRRGKVRFYKNLLESKSLCAPVGPDMIAEAYVKHRKSLCRPQAEVLRVPQEFLRELFEYGKEVGSFLAKDYDPYKTSLPNTKATVEKNRFKGGARAALAERIEVQKGPLYLSLLDGNNRPEPFVMGLFGPPGCGKTTMVGRVVAALGRRLFPSRKGKELVYARSCSSEFWDGYTGQPIVVLDDIGQNVQNHSDLVEFEHLVSSNRYVVPMAHLENKGLEFTSPIIICTSNLEYNSRLCPPTFQGTVLEDERAFWRRFHLPIRVFKFPQTHMFENKLSVGDDALLFPQVREAKCFRMRPKRNNRDDEDTLGRALKLDNSIQSCMRNHTPDDRKITFVKAYIGTLEVVEDLVSSYRKHVDFHAHNLTGEWRQTLKCLGAEVKQAVSPFYEFTLEEKAYPDSTNDLSLSILYPEFPPYHSPIVEAVAIPEPLKVRMITKAEATTKVLQPFQRSLFRYLKTQPQFVLTHGVSWGVSTAFDRKLEWIYRIEGEIKALMSNRKEGDMWLSGDYTAATDNFPMSVTNALIEGILSQIDHEPTKAWVRYEVSPHRIMYPGGVTEKQTSGQLMGSLISFPLLCFLNDFIVRRHFEEGKYLINGDDVVALGSPKEIAGWRADAPKVGLDLSIGKNFIDQHFCCVNSQLFYDGQVQHTGKVSCQTRYGKTLAYCYQESQFYYGENPDLRREFIRRNICELRKSPRSLDVPTTHGGLGLFFTSREDLDVSMARRVYLHSFLKPYLKSTGVPGFDYLRALAVPVGIFSDSEMELAGGLPTENQLLETLLSLDLDPVDSSNEELSHPILTKDEKIYHTEANCRVLNQIKASNFREFPPISHNRFRTVFVQKGRIGFFKEKVIHLALQTLLSYIRSDLKKDPENDFVQIHREYLEELDPLFGTDAFKFSLDEVDGEDAFEEMNVFDSIPEKIYPWESLTGPVWEEIFSMRTSTLAKDLLEE